MGCGHADELFSIREGSLSACLFIRIVSAGAGSCRGVAVVVLSGFCGALCYGIARAAGRPTPCGAVGVMWCAFRRITRSAVAPAGGVERRGRSRKFPRRSSTGMASGGSRRAAGRIARCRCDAINISRQRTAGTAVPARARHKKQAGLQHGSLGTHDAKAASVAAYVVRRSRPPVVPVAPPHYHGSWLIRSGSIGVGRCCSRPRCYRHVFTSGPSSAVQYAIRQSGTVDASGYAQGRSGSPGRRLRRTARPGPH